MCIQMDSFSSQPALKAIMRPTSKGCPSSDSEILYMSSLVSRSAESLTAW